jgi:hypothetical protein
MSRSSLFATGSMAIVAAFTLTFAGCSQSATKDDGSLAATPSGSSTQPASDGGAVSAPNASATAEHEGEHSHTAGAHGGTIVSLGRNSYHVEAIVTTTGELRLYTLGSDESRVIDIETQDLVAYAKTSGGTDATSIALKAQPQPGDASGKSSLFVAQLPQSLVAVAVDVTIPNITIRGERFRLGFTTKTDDHADAVMPGKVADEAEKKLYLSPGGLYTQADIEANGRMTASEKFKGFRAKHDLHPKPGDKICPVTLTLANPACTWIIGGKKYEFCCPPCVDNFLEMAKSEQTAKEIQDPEYYVKK